MEPEIPNPIVMQANYRQFGSGENSDSNFSMQSRMLAWCRGGSGVVNINGTKRVFNKGDAVFARWNSISRFRADKQSPFYFAAVHIIPHLAEGGVVDFRLLRGDQNPQPFHSQRLDACIEGLGSESIFFQISEAHRLGHLMHYIIQWFHEKTRTETITRLLGQLVLHEMAALAGEIEETSSSFPNELQQMLTTIDWNFADADCIERLAKAASCSRSTVCRMFKKHLNTTPTNWILSVRMKRATNLLLSTNLRINEIARRVGFANTHYFCRIFKRIHGLTASEYRTEAAF